MKQEMRRFTLDLPSNQHSMFKIVAAQKGITMREYFIESALKNMQNTPRYATDEEFKRVMDKVLTEHDEMFKRLADK
jgi:hypothetical protein